MKRTEKGYTLIELTIVVAIISILARIMIVQAGDAIARANDATTLGNLAVLRVTLSSYSDDHDGFFPAFGPEVMASTSPVSGYSSLLHDALVPNYIREIPEARESGGHHKASNSVSVYWNQTGQDDNEANGMGRGWRYDANYHDVGVFGNASGFGSIFVLCNHMDLKGNSWTTH